MIDAAYKFISLTLARKLHKVELNLYDILNKKPMINSHFKGSRHLTNIALSS